MLDAKLMDPLAPIHLSLVGQEWGLYGTGDDDADGALRWPLDGRRDVYI